MPPSILWDLILPDSFSELSPMPDPHCAYSLDLLVGARIRPSSRCLDLRSRRSGEKSRSGPGDSTSEAARMKPALKRPGCVLRIRVRAKRPLAEAHVDGVVEPLHPDLHFGSAPGAWPAVGHPVERLPETSPETDFEGQRQRTLCECGTRYHGTDGFAGIRRVLPLPQRGRYSAILDKETDLRFVHRKKRALTGKENFGSGEFGRQLFLRPPRFEKGEETERTASEGLSTQGEALPPRWAERPAIPTRAQPLGLTRAASNIAQTAASNVQGMFNRSENAK